MSQLANVGPKGIAIEICGNRVERLYQKISWTSSGVPRKNQMNSPATASLPAVLGHAGDGEDQPEDRAERIATTVRPRRHMTVR